MSLAKSCPAALIALIASASACAGTAFVNFGSTAQTIEGFGGATPWMPTLTSTQANALFGNANAQQIGLSILRVRIDPGGSGNWGTELANAQAARARGASVIATPWTPPASMKTNNNVVGGMLKTTSYAAFATYLESFVDFFASSGVPLSAISMQNEPDANVTYESCSWSGAQMDTWVANNAATLTIPLMMPESESFTTSLSDPALNDARAVGHIGFIAGHIYGVTPQPYPNAVAKGKQVWMTEHYLTGSGISGALQVAKEINDSMSVANYNAYVWWWAHDWPQESFSFGLIDASSNVKPAGYAMAQYSKFVRPGYLRYNSTYNPSTNVYVTAYGGSAHHVIVAINMGSAAVSQPFTLQGATITALTPYQTSPSHNLAQLGAVTVSNGAFTYSLPAQSITTFAN
jgi:glucuronoarabinoxylan endo-1,4-beta-xylanase